MHTEVPTDSSIPERFYAQIVAINAAIQAGNLTDAAEQAAQADEQIAAAYGPIHSHTINIRELRGFIAQLDNDNSTACLWYLHTAALRLQTYGPSDSSTREAAHQALAMWHRIPSPDELQHLAPDLIALLTEVESPNSGGVRRIQACLAMSARSGSGPGQGTSAS